MDNLFFKVYLLLIRLKIKILDIKLTFILYKLVIEAENVQNASGLMEYNTKKRKEFSTHGRDMSQAFIGYVYKYLNCFSYLNIK